MSYSFYLDLEQAFIYSSAPSFLLSIMTITLNIFVINYYRKSDLSVVSLLYTLIATMDIICATGTIHKYIAVLLFYKNLISGRNLDVNAMIFYFFTQVSYRCSVFCNLVLAVSRTIMILKPFYQINIKVVKFSFVLCCVFYISLDGMNLHEFGEYYFGKVYGGALLIGSGLAYKLIYVSGINEENRHRYLIVSILPDLIGLMVPVIIVIITCIIQVISLQRSSQFPTNSNQRHVTITVLLMSTLFVLCNSALSVYLFILMVIILTGNDELGQIWASEKAFPIVLVVTGTVLPILNAALNPVIIISRSNGLRNKLLNSLRRLR